MRVMLDRIGERMGRVLPRLESVLFPLHRGFTYRVAIVLSLVVIAFVVRRLIGPPEFGCRF